MGGKGGGGTSTIQTQAIPEFAQEFFEQASTLALQETQAAPQFTAEQAVAGLDPLQQQSLLQQQQLAEQGSPLVPAGIQSVLGLLQGTSPAGQALTQTAQGQFLPGGVQGDLARQTFESLVRRGTPGVSSSFEAAGRTGSGLAQTGQAEVAANALAGVFGQERGRQLQAAGRLGQLQLAGAGAAPGLAEARFADATRLFGIGAQRQSQEQALLDATRQLADQPRQQALQLLGQGGVLQGAGGSSRQETFGGGSSTAQTLGTIAALAAIIKVIGPAIAASDERIKDNIRDVEPSKLHEFVDSIKPMEFNFKGAKENEIGISAQEIEKGPLEGAVNEVMGIKTIDLRKLTPALAVTVKDLDRRIGLLEKK